MKTYARLVLAFFLAVLARAILRTYKPKIVMVTGSVGKTSTKDAVAAALGVCHDLRASEKSYNSEFGVPLTIIGAGNPWFDLSKWMRVFTQGLALIFTKQPYPKLLVLEVGADRPNDVKNILKIATPDAVVVTRLPDIPVHVEAYASAEAVREEEFAPAYALPPQAPLIVCADDPHALRLASRLSARVTTFGCKEDADVRITSISVDEGKRGVLGMQAQILHKDKEYTLYVPQALGSSQVFAPAAAFACALALGMSGAKALQGLKNYVPPSGRGKVLAGVHGSLIIDDTYNASPAAVEKILESLSMLEAKRRIAILGDMLELGRYSLGEHERIGTLAATHADVVVAVGVRSRAIASAAQTAGAKEVKEYADAYAAAAHLADFVQEGDVVLIKGSQSMRMERIVEALLADKTDITKLVRQEKEWKSIP